MFRFNGLLVLLTMLSCNPAIGAEGTTSALTKDILAADQLLFDEGFNKCDLDVFRENLHPDLEFLHDVSGESDFEQFFASFEEHICGNPNGKLSRKLVFDSSSVYPLKNNDELYAAVQLGNHEFYFTPKGGEPVLTSTARFVHTYYLVDGKWKLKRVISYDHQNAASNK